MFGKKKDKAAAEPKSAAAPTKASANKKKNTLSKGGPGFLGAHVEKIVLTVVLLAIGYFIYGGFSAEGYPTTRVPETLQKDAGELLTQIKQDHWDEIAAERQVEHNFAEMVADARRPTDPSLYDNGVWDPKPQGVFEKRGDPTLLPPEDLAVTNVFGALAVMVPKEDLDPYDAWEDAEPIKPKEKKRRGRGGNEAGGEGGYGGAGYGGAGYGGEAGGTYGGGAGSMGTGAEPKRFLNAAYDLGAPIGGMAGSAGGYGGGMGGMGMGGMGMGGMGMGGMGVGGAGTGTRDGLGKNKDRGPKNKVASKGVMFNAITALVPHKKMAEEFLNQFEATGTFNARRDMPAYLSFEVQRVDVTGAPGRAIQEAEWKLVTDGTENFNLPKNQKWAIRPPIGRRVQEVIDRNAVSPGLTMPIPPMLVTDFRYFSKHPSINWAWNAKMLAPPRLPPPGTEPPGEGNDDVLPGAGGAAGGAAAGGGMYGGGAGGMYGGGAGYGGGGYGGAGGEGYGGGMYGGGEGGAGYGGGGYGGAGDAGGGYGGGEGYGGGMYGGGEGYGGGMYGGGSGYGGGMYGGGGMGGMGGMGGSPTAPQPEFKMVRCYDMLPMNVREIGKVYRYRVRLVMRDPNYPEDRRIPMPAPSELKDDVWARVSAVMKKDDEAIKKDDNTRRTLRYTDWSEPSPPVLVRAPFEVYAGKVEYDGPRKFMTSGMTFSVSTSEPEASVVAAAMDFNTGATFAAKTEVRRGSVLSEKIDAELIVPNTKIVKMKEDYILDTRATVADIRGGVRLAGNSRDDPLEECGELMILHRDGRIEISNEIDDTFLYRMYSFADEHEAAEKAGSTAGSAGMGGAGYGGGAGNAGGGY